jgi:hypothetical protein
MRAHANCHYRRFLLVQGNLLQDISLILAFKTTADDILLDGALAVTVSPCTKHTTQAHTHLVIVWLHMTVSGTSALSDKRPNIFWWAHIPLKCFLRCTAKVYTPLQTFFKAHVEKIDPDIQICRLRKDLFDHARTSAVPSAPGGVGALVAPAIADAFRVGAVHTRVDAVKGGPVQAAARHRGVDARRLAAVAAWRVRERQYTTRHIMECV